MLLGRIVPGYVVKVIVDGCVLKLFCITNDGVEVAFRGGEEICIVHQNCTGQIVPSPYAVVNEWPGKSHPSRTYIRREQY